MDRWFQYVDRLSVWVGKAFAWLIILMTVGICYEVFMRYVVRNPTAWAYDAGYMFYGALFIMAGAYALATQSHVRGDVVYQLFPVRVQASIDLVLFLLFFFPGILALIYSGYIFAERAWIMNEHSSSSPAGPPLYHFKSLIPLSGVFLLLQGIVETLRCVYCIKNGYWPSRYQDVEEIDVETAHEYVAADELSDSAQAISQESPR